MDIWVFLPVGGDGGVVDWFGKGSRVEALWGEALHLSLLLLNVAGMVWWKGWRGFILDSSHSVSLGHYAAPVAG